MCVTICGEFNSNEGGIAGYVDRMRDKFPAKWGVQMAVMNFQTRSKTHDPLFQKYQSLFHNMFPYRMNLRISFATPSSLLLPANAKAAFLQFSIPFSMANP